MSISRALPPSQGLKCTDTNGNDQTRSGHGLDTQVCKNAFTDKRIGKGIVSSRCRYPTLLLLATLAVPVWAQQAEEDPGVSNESIRPLNLSIPRYAMGSSSVGSQPSGTLDPQRHLADLPDLGTRSGGDGSGQSGRLPYGSGYEARQRQLAGGEGSGFGGSQGGGRGAGGHGIGGRR